MPEKTEEAFAEDARQRRAVLGADQAADLLLRAVLANGEVQVHVQPAVFEVETLGLLVRLQERLELVQLLFGGRFIADGVEQRTQLEGQRRQLAHRYPSAASVRWMHSISVARIRPRELETLCTVRPSCWAMPPTAASPP